jgi:hypothetical protein
MVRCAVLWCHAVLCCGGRCGGGWGWWCAVLWCHAVLCCAVVAGVVEGGAGGVLKVKNKHGDDFIFSPQPFLWHYCCVHVQIEVSRGIALPAGAAACLMVYGWRPALHMAGSHARMASL